MTNPPLTFIINVMNITALITGTSETMIPANFGAVASGGIIAHFYTKETAKKYTNGNQTKVRLADLAFHWFPAIALYSLNRKRIKRKHATMAMVLPLVYFSVKHDNNNVRLVNPIKHLQETYPGVPLWVFSLYAVGAMASTRK